ncbi:MAG: DUF4097 family beta strand repeat-containing protein [Candidatus Nanopelagicaceae bacterium]|nr:DUF4097 family beta strand repeat-containing protein [Candidatus Nanopelagicaceae bacterium]
MIKQSGELTRSEVFDIENALVHLEMVSEDITVRESADGQCHIQIFAKSENGRKLADEAEIQATGKKITIRVRWKETGFKRFFNGFSDGVTIVLELPRSAALSIKAVSADIEIESTLSSIDVNLVSGDISVLQNPTSRCALKTVSGDITAHTYSACDYTLRSVSGDIKVHVAPGLDIDVDGKSLSGDTESEISLSSNPNSSGVEAERVTISATTVSGDIKLARN